MPKSGERGRGLHAVTLVGREDDGEVLVFRNSWGAGWGDRGYGRVDRQYLDAYMYDSWLSRNARYGLTALTYDKYFAATTNAQRRAILLIDNPRWRTTIRYAGMNYQLIVYETLSINDEKPAEIIELRNPLGIRVGWCETFHGTSNAAVVKELFVWPPFRRRGYGTILEAAAAIRAKAWWADQLVLWLHQPDALPASRANGRLFASDRGYEWTWRKSSRPALAGFAAKRIDVAQAKMTLRSRRSHLDAYTHRADPRGLTSPKRRP